MGDLVHFKSVQVGSTVVAGSNVPTFIGTMELANTTAAVAYLQIFWKASGDVTLGTTAPDVVIPLPASGGAVLHFEEEGWKTEGTAWSMAGTTTRTGNTQALIDVVIWKKR